MTFAPDFAFYRDDRRLDGPFPDEIWEDMKIEMGRIWSYRTEAFPVLVRRGQMTAAEADKLMRSARALAEDAYVFPRSPKPPATWTEMVHDLRREIAFRRRRLASVVGGEQRVEAERRLLIVERMHDFYWHFPSPEPTEARRATAAARATRAAA